MRRVNLAGALGLNFRGFSVYSPNGYRTNTGKGFKEYANIIRDIGELPNFTKLYSGSVKKGEDYFTVLYARIYKLGCMKSFLAL